MAKEEMKTVKIAASTHARLMLLSDLFDGTISEVIDRLIEETYPQISEEADKLQKYKDSLRQNLVSKGKSNKE
jgi:transaldolase